MAASGRDDEQRGDGGAETRVQPYSIDTELANASRAPDGLYPSAVRPAVFRALWVSLGILIAILGLVAVEYGHTVGW